MGCCDSTGVESPVAPPAELEVKPTKKGRHRRNMSSFIEADSRPRYLIETEEVQKLIESGDPMLRLVNCSFYLPGQSEVPADE